MKCCLAGSLQQDERCDVLILGAGITGALVARELLDAGLDVVIVDRGEVAAGSTAASTALVQYDTDLPLLELADKIGRCKADQVYLATRGALDDLADRIARDHIDCDFAWRPSLYLSSANGDVDFLKQECAARRRLGIEASWLDAASLVDRYGIAGRGGAIRSTAALEVDPQKLTRGLLDRCLERGARLYTYTDIELDDCSAKPIVARSSAGHCIRARDVIFATGYSAPERFATLREFCSLQTTYAASARPIYPAFVWPDRAMLWEHDDPYLYARTTPDGRVLIGGGDEPTTDPAKADAHRDRKIGRLVERFNELMPTCPVEVESTWSGVFASTDDSLALIGKAPGARGDNCHFALGFGGNGMTFGVLASHILRDAILRRSPHPAAQLFSFDRFRTAHKPQPQPQRPRERALNLTLAAVRFLF
ncbi:MAG: FAD-binding oxidoreductase [Tepidisphaeraceae bacterium]